MSMHRRIAQSWLSQATRNSAAPFLYQTRTLNKVHPPLRLKSQPRSLFSTSDSPVQHQPPPENSQSTTTDHLRVHEIEHEQKHEFEPEYEHEQPDESQPQAEPAPAPRRSFLQRRGAALAKKQIPAEKPYNPYAKPKPRNSKREKTPARLTTDETRTFAGLFEKLGYKELKEAELNLERQSAELESTDPQSTETQSTEIAQISAIFDAVAKEMGKKQKTSDVSQSQREDAAEGATTEAFKEPPPKLKKLPTPIYTNEELSERLDNQELTPAEAIESIVMRETVNIKAAFDNAVNDNAGEAEIWKICEESIFSMMQHIGNKQETPVLHPPKTPGDGPNLNDTTSTIATPPSPLQVPPGIPIEPIVTKLYPQMLLHAFRLINLHFSDSPLIGQFRSTITSLGRESTVLGASTALYNEMIYFCWCVRYDLPGVISLLREMEVIGIEPNQRTCSNLNLIPRNRKQDVEKSMQRGAQGSREPWWDLPVNRKAMRELTGPDGWIPRLTERLKEKEKREKIFSQRDI
ncbi:hypothetical protein BJX99DRAFT_222275 [Aspergillus californicus]